MIKFLGDEQDQITFVTRAVRVVDLITNLDMAAFQSHSGLSIFICRLEVSVMICIDILWYTCIRLIVNPNFCLFLLTLTWFSLTFLYISICSMRLTCQGKSALLSSSQRFKGLMQLWNLRIWTRTWRVSHCCSINERLL